MFHIYYIKAIEVLDSRGNPTVETTVKLFNVDNDRMGVGIVAIPSGASTGSNEALELRDNDPKRFLGKGVLKAVANVNEIISKQIDFVKDIYDLDTKLIELDGTENKSNLGANAILSVSLASALAMANSYELPLYKLLGGESVNTIPVPLLNVINGGVHADNSIDIQEFMLVPWGFSKYSEALRAAVETFHHLKRQLKEKGYSTAVGDEGGFAPNIKTTEEVLDIITNAIQKAGYEPGENISIALDSAATELYDNGQYQFKKANSKKFGNQEFIKLYESWLEKYPIISLEDPLAEDDWEGWKLLTKNLGDKVQLVGDDIFCTNINLINKGLENKVANAVLIKPNQIGTVTEALKAVRLARDNGYHIVVSHRSGETESNTLAHIAMGFNAHQIKTGGCCRSERLAKYNELLRIENDLGEGAKYWGRKAFKHLHSK